MADTLVDGLTQEHLDLLSWIGGAGQRWTHSSSRTFFKPALFELETRQYLEIIEDSCCCRDILGYAKLQNANDCLATVAVDDQRFILLRLTLRGTIICKMFGITTKVPAEPPHYGMSNRF